MQMLCSELSTCLLLLAIFSPPTAEKAASPTTAERSPGLSEPEAGWICREGEFSGSLSTPG